MFITEVTDPLEQPLKASDLAAHALKRMKDCGETSKAVVDFTTRKLLGEVSHDSLTLLRDTNVVVMQHLNKVTARVSPDTHILDAAGFMNRNKLSQVYITDDEQRFLGTAKNSDVFRAISILLNPEVEGAVIMVQVSARDYQLSDLVRIIELEGVKIFGIGVQHIYSESEYPDFRISIKLNHSDTSRVIHVLNRYGYVILSETQKEENDDELHDRADELMRYLSI